MTRPSATRDCLHGAQAGSPGTAKTHFWLLDGVHSLFALVINVVFQVGMLCCSIQQVYTTEHMCSWMQKKMDKQQRLLFTLGYFYQGTSNNQTCMNSFHNDFRTKKYGCIQTHEK